MNNRERNKTVALRPSFHKSKRVCVCVCVCVKVWTLRDASDHEDGTRSRWNLNSNFRFLVSVAKITDKGHKRNGVTLRVWEGVRVGGG